MLLYDNQDGGNSDIFSKHTKALKLMQNKEKSVSELGFVIDDNGDIVSCHSAYYLEIHPSTI